MAQRTQLDDVNNPLHEAYAYSLSNGMDGAGEALRILVNEASGLSALSTCRSRLTNDLPSALERGSRSEQTMNLALTEMYV